MSVTMFEFDLIAMGAPAVTLVPTSVGFKADCLCFGLFFVVFPQ